MGTNNELEKFLMRKNCPRKIIIISSPLLPNHFSQCLSRGGHFFIRILVSGHHLGARCGHRTVAIIKMITARTSLLKWI